MLKALIATTLFIQSNMTFAVQATVPVLSVNSLDDRYYSVGSDTELITNKASSGNQKFDLLAVRDIKQRGFGLIPIHISGEATTQCLLHMKKMAEACTWYNLIPVSVGKAQTKNHQKQR